MQPREGNILGFISNPLSAPFDMIISIRVMMRIKIQLRTKLIRAAIPCLYES